MVTLNRRLAVRVALAAVMPLISLACGSSEPAPPVASATLTASKVRLPLGAPVDFTYRFEALPSATIAGDYRVFVQFRNESGDILWQDDHDPPVPTSQWKSGQPVEYTRTLFVPVVPHLGDASVDVGLYSENDRLPLQGPSAPSERETADRAYRLLTLHLLPTSESVFIIYKSGWHPDEFEPNNPALSWKWMQKSGVLSIRNPRRDVTLYLEYDARPDLFPDQPQQVTLYAGDQVVTTFAADAVGPRLLRIPISAAQLGTDEMTDLRIDLDRSFVPAKLPAGGRDIRELGIRVYHAFVEER